MPQQGGWRSNAPLSLFATRMGPCRGAQSAYIPLPDPGFGVWEGDIAQKPYYVDDKTVRVSLNRFVDGSMIKLQLSQILRVI